MALRSWAIRLRVQAEMQKIWEQGASPWSA